MISVGLDIDETLIVTERYVGLIDRPDDADFYFDCEPFRFAMYKRNGIDDFLSFIKSNFNLFFYTRATEEYANKILHHLGCQEYPLFHRGDTLRVEIPPIAYETRPTVYFKKDLNLIANRLNVNIRDIVFIDDVRNDKEITPIDSVIEIPEMDIEFQDFDLKVVQVHFEEALKMRDVVQYMKSLHFLI